MKIKKMFVDNLVNQYVVKKVDGTYARFFCSPFRNITEVDLVSIPYYSERESNAYEVSDYVYNLYGLCKE